MNYSKFKSKQEQIDYLRSKGTIVGKELHLPQGIMCNALIQDINYDKPTILCSKLLIPDNVISYPKNLCEHTLDHLLTTSLN